MLRHSPIIIALLASLLALGACGGGQPAPPAATPGATVPAEGQAPAGGGAGAVDACRLLSTDEVSAALGVTIVRAGDTVEASDAEMGFCDYHSADGIALMIAYTPNAQPFIFEAWKAVEDAEPVGGIGDEAVFASSTLFITKGAGLVSMGGADLDVLRQLGALVASRM
jgi:hypothetical protein